MFLTQLPCGATLPAIRGNSRRHDRDLGAHLPDTHAHDGLAVVAFHARGETRPVLSRFRTSPAEGHRLLRQERAAEAGHPDVAALTLPSPARGRDFTPSRRGRRDLSGKV